MNGKTIFTRMLNQNMHSSKGSKIISYAIIPILLILGMYLVPFRLMHFNLEFIPGNLGDTRLNNYFLEHGFKYLSGQYPDFWSAPFFYPARDAMTFSDNFLGTLPIYALYRFVKLDRETAYQLWFLTIFILNYLSCVWVLRKLSINRLGAAVGGFVFAFSLPVIARIGHSQLHARFMVPLAFYFMIRYLEKHNNKYFMMLCLSVIVQFYCTIYIGYFLVLCLLLFLLSYNLVDFSSSRLYKIAWGSSKDFTGKILIIVISAIGMLPLMLPYYRRSLDSGTNSWEVVSSMLPRIQSFFYPVSGSLMWNWMRPIGRSLPMPWEHEIFIGILPWLAFIIIPIYYITSHKRSNLIKIAMISFVAVLFILLTIVIWNGLSLYSILTYVPGFNAIRAVNRIILVIAFLFSFLLGSVITIVGNEKHNYLNLFFKVSLPIFLICLVMVDQNVKISYYDRYSKKDAQERSKQIEIIVRKKNHDAKVIAYMPDKLEQPYKIHLDAMMAAQDLNIATINGYSGNIPFDYYDIFVNYDNCDSLYKWESASSMRLGLLEQKNDLFKDLIIVGKDDCRENKHTYTLIDHPLPDTAYIAGISFSSPRVDAQENTIIHLPVKVVNSSGTTWSSLNNIIGGKYKIYLSYRWLSSDHNPMSGFDARMPLPYDVHPGEQVKYDLEINVPPKKGTYFLEFDLVQEWVTWFHQKGSPLAAIEIAVGGKAQ